MTESHCYKHVLLHLRRRISTALVQATVRAEWGFLSPGYWGLSAPVWGFLSRGLSAPVWGFLSPGYSAPVWSSLAHEQSQAERRSQPRARTSEVSQQSWRSLRELRLNFAFAWPAALTPSIFRRAS